MPPALFTMGKFGPAGVLPDRVYSKAELLACVVHGRKKCRQLIAGLTNEGAQARFRDLAHGLQRAGIAALPHVARAAPRSTPRSAVESVVAAACE
jgi:hypothetical protein